MRRHTLPALIAAAWCTTALVSSHAMDTPKTSDKKAHVAVEPTVKATVAAAHVVSAPANTAAKSDVVGSVNNKEFTWSEVLSHLEKDDPQAYVQALASAVAMKAAEAKFGLNGVNTITVTRADALAALRKAPPRPVVTELSRMLQTEALHQQLVANHLADPTDAEVNTYLSRLLKDLRERGIIKAGQTDEEFLRERNYTRAKLVGDLRPQVETFALVHKDLEKKLGHPVSDADYVQASHILIATAASGLPFATQPTPDDPKKADADALAKITAIASDIKSGKKTFEQAAKESSDDPGSKEKSGDLGPFVRGTMYPEFEAVTFKLEPGVVSDPIKTQAGWHIIKVTKLGKSMTAAEKQKALDTYDQAHSQAYMQQMMTGAGVGIVNKLQPQGLPPGMAPPGGARGRTAPPQ